MTRNISILQHTLVVCGLQFIVLLVIVLQSGHLLYADELLHAVSAQRFLAGNNYLAETHEVLGHEFGVHRLPLFLLYYVGGLKTYLLSGWFWVFGSSTISLRIFTALCGSLVSGLTYFFVACFFSRKAAVITTVLLLFDPSFVLSRVFDWGPVSSQDMLKMLLVIVSFALYAQQSSGLTVLFGLLSGLLLWDKLNAWWLVIPLWMMLLGKRSFGWKSKGLLFTSFIVSIIPLAILIWKRPWFYSESVKSFRAFENYALLHRDNPLLWNLLSNYVSDWNLRLIRFWDVLSGVAIPNYVLVKPIIPVSSFAVLVLFVFVVLIVQLFVARKNIKLRFLHLLGLMLSISLFLLFTPHANSIHHFLMLYPLLHVIVGIVLAANWKRFQMAIFSLLLITGISNLMVLNSFVAQSRQTKNVKVYWQMERVQKATERLKDSQTGLKVASLDWGISLPIAFLSNGRVAIEDLQPFTDPRCQEIAKKSADGYIFIRYADVWVFETYGKECPQFLL